MSARGCALAVVLLAGSAGAADDAPELFQGFLVAASASDVYAPEFSFRVGGWNSNWGRCKILELAPDGKEVKAGAVIARFEFGARDALPWINDRIRRVSAEANESRISGEQALETLAIEQRRKEIESRLAGIDLGKERAISRRAADLYRIVQKLAEFEVDAASQRLTAITRSKGAELEFHERAVAHSNEDLKRYSFYEKRFQVLAPRDGVVRHAFNPRERRKVQKGDALESGQRIVALATDATLAVKFFVPEHRMSELREGLEITVQTQASGEEHQAVVRGIDFFPQEVGFLMENEALPNAREKAFAVKAVFAASPAGMAAGSEVKVKVKSR
ncbi:MAG: hypothetical protein H6Q89_2434 [Myxococcaceae bacterium]|nr:hypothetical protein [Myxococcaceae bacterium]